MGPVAELRSLSPLAGDPRLREEIEVIERNALRLGKLVNTLLDFSRIEAGRIEARFAPVDLAAATVELASVFRSAVERAGLAIRGRLPTAGRARLHRPRHVGAGRPQPAVQRAEVHLRAARSPSGCARSTAPRVLTVSDTGTGIPAAELPAAVRALPPGGDGPRPLGRGQRDRPGHGARAGRPARRHDRRRAAPPASAPPSPSPCRWAPRTCPPTGSRRAGPAAAPALPGDRCPLRGRGPAVAARSWASDGTAPRRPGATG